ncbi:MAG: hypothetical protein LBQ47_00470 [Endomicrobium sp.]|jgi:hypothetical protein|nr:hypothetical protein [Endomicrobium sp.]
MTIVILAVVAAVYFGAYAYISWRISSGLSLKSPYKWYFFAAMAAVSLVVPLSRFLGIHGVIIPFTDLAYIISLFFTALKIFTVLFILNDIINIANLFLKIKDFRYISTLITILIALICCAVWAVMSDFLYFNEASTSVF